MNRNGDIDEAVRKLSRSHAEKVEQALASRDEVTFIDERGVAIVYRVPSWWRHPIRRFKIFRIRRRIRRGWKRV